MRLWKEDADWQTNLANILLFAFAALTALMVHELCHAKAADMLGDQTARKQGRLTLNPLKHVDPLGMLMLMIVGFGWAKPVMIDTTNLKNPRRDMSMIALAGPVSNFLLAMLMFFLIGFLRFIDEWPMIISVLFSYLYVTATINIVLGVFNLFPIPPLDGSKVLGSLLPENLYYKLLRYEKFGMLILVAALFLGWIDRPLFFLRDTLEQALSAAALWPSDMLEKIIYG